jgi:DNA-binding XRE family transcriptional regulator
MAEQSTATLDLSRNTRVPLLKIKRRAYKRHRRQPRRTAMATDEEKAGFRREIGERLRVVREIKQMAQGEFAKRAGLTPSAYNQIELGETMPRIESAIALRNAHGLTLDYIYCGDPGDLEPSLRRAIEALRLARNESAGNKPRP